MRMHPWFANATVDADSVSHHTYFTQYSPHAKCHEDAALIANAALHSDSVAYHTYSTHNISPTLSFVMMHH